MLPFNKNLQQLSRELRKNMTDAKRRLWGKIRRKQVNGKQFYRQKNIGDFIVDFHRPASRLIIEIDGSQHQSPEGIAKDRARDDYLLNLGYRVLRFLNLEIFQNIDGVTETISRHVENPP